MKKVSTLILSSLLLSTTSLLATSTLKQNTDILVDGKSVGYISVLTPVSTDGSLVTVKGFRLESYPQLVVRDMKRGEVYVEFDEDKEKIAMDTLKVIKSYEDDYGEIWQEVEGTLAVDPSMITNDAAPLYKQAKTTYGQTCSMCHHLPEPHAYTVNQWPQQIEMMMEQFPLEKPTKSLLIKYLQHNAADAK